MGRPPSLDERLRLQYEEACKSYHAVTDFRAKLLALLPFASGAAIGVLVSNSVDRSYLTVFGLLGFATVAGLFMHELRGIQYCLELERTAENLEHEMGLPSALGQFSILRPGRLHGFIGASGAAAVVYPAVMLAWVYLGGLGAHVWAVLPGWLLILPYSIIVVTVFRWTRSFGPGRDTMLKQDRTRQSTVTTLPPQHRLPND